MEAKKTIISQFRKKENYGRRYDYAVLYEISGNYIVEYKYTSMEEKEVQSFGIDKAAAKVFYLERFFFLHS